MKIFYIVVLIGICHVTIAQKKANSVKTKYLKTLLANTGIKNANMFYLDKIGYSAAMEFLRTNSTASPIFGYQTSSGQFLLPDNLNDEVKSCSFVTRRNLDELFTSNKGISAIDTGIITMRMHTVFMEKIGSPPAHPTTKLYMLYEEGMRKLQKKLFLQCEKLCEQNNTELIIISMNDLCYNRRFLQSE